MNIFFRFSISLFLILISFSCFSQTNKKKSLKYFEGELIYEINYLPLDKTINPERIQQLFGSKIVHTIKKGNSKKAYYNNEGKLVETRYNSIKDKKSYSERMDEDTIFWYDITNEMVKMDITSIKDTLIENQTLVYMTCQVQIEGQESIDFEPYFYFSKIYLFNPKWYKSFTENDTYKLYKAAKGYIVIGYEPSFYFARSYQLKKVNKRKVNAEEVKPKFSKDKILKEI